MKIRGVLFDKDGTLIDFFGLWLEAAQKVIPQFIRRNGFSRCEDLENALYESIGICDGQVDPNGALAYKSFAEIAEDIGRVLEKYSLDFDKKRTEDQMKRMFEKAMQGEDAKIVPLAELGGLFEELKAREICIGLATADTQKSAENCMRKLGVLEYLDYLGADDGRKQPKPAPDMLLDFARQNKIQPAEVLVAGDTRNDMLFAKKAGAKSAGVLSGVSKEKDLREYADFIIPSVEEIPKLLDALEGEI